MASAHEWSAMRWAIAISAQGLGSTSPNPPVGCVVLDSRGRAVGEGHHVRKGEPHAEANALAAAGGRAEGGTAVVTLEPCNHAGRTPPCREALIRARVARVVIAVMDPTSRGEGGAALLRQAGIDVEVGVLQEEALVVLGPWLTSLRAGRPFVTWVYEAGPDGAPIGRGACRALRGEVAAVRAAHDLVVTWDGRLEEGRPGSHGRDVFAVPDSGIFREPPGVARSLLAAGARSVLVEGHAGEAASLLGVCPADRVIVYVPGTPESWAPAAGRGAALPDGYRLTGARREGEFVRLAGRRV
ncbi:MAG TPA: bifunctional diaminohydroxyphosphoribosylaminopyrimidine deaminase/5-amino-6-(5-phosphoribosylamino)uracil reductase RibD [Streptomyces sp.]|nr:bifunctional diaminohydroxyphosphoribosylaminopyrimidine deaminase/5-amino-6-(5-phosphoribosylamino)uracil reductase RibD [Streptomyces sp.]